uniref:Methyltransferase family protein n=1 Tax=Tetraselmis sp. GSL018 TaxID=582737 RepID=A0A061RNX5_9CHLO
MFGPAAAARANGLQCKPRASGNTCCLRVCFLQDRSLLTITFRGRNLGTSFMDKPTCICRGYVGETTPAAAQYHCNDFSWEELRVKAEPLLASQTTCVSDNRFVHGSECDSSAWEDFHSAHSTARFFKEKRYLVLEFPVLVDQLLTKHVLEIGSGCGSSLLPVLRENPAASATACDVSETALQLLRDAADRAGICPSRLFAADAAAPEALARMQQLRADACLLVFTLSAVPPGSMRAVLTAAHAALRPGGLLLFRDYALYDMSQLRFPPEQRVGERLYRRLDGTLSYYFTAEDLTARAEEVGFRTVEASYACVRVRNRRKGLEMDRAFVHGVFKKAGRPEGEGGD